MTIRPILILLLLFTPGIAMGNSCGAIPSAPDLLEEAQLASAQLETLDPQMEGYFSDIEAYRGCIDNEVAQLAPVDATEEYFTSAAYQQAFQDLIGYSEQAQQQMGLAIERYNYLIGILNRQ